MSNKRQQGRLNQGKRSQSELLDELDSLKDLLNEELDETAPINSISDIRSVKEYMLFKQKAESAGLDLDTYLTQRAEGRISTAKSGEGGAIPMLNEVVTVDAMRFGAGTSAAAAQGNGNAAMSTLAEVDKLTRNTPSSQKLSLEALEQLVASIVEQKLQAIKPQLEKQVFDQIRNRLPIDSFK